MHGLHLERRTKIVLKRYWALETVAEGEARFAKPTRVRKYCMGAVYDEWEITAFGWRLFVAIKRRL